MSKGGSIYKSPNENYSDIKSELGPGVIIGPHRVVPGHLSVSRTFGDPLAKLVKFGGKPGIVIASPDIFSFKITPSHDFLVLGCDGIYDELSSQEVIDCVWNSTSNAKGTFKNLCENAAESINKRALQKRSLDNVTSLIIAFENFQRIINEKRKEDDKNNLNMHYALPHGRKENIQFNYKGNPYRSKSIKDF